MKETNAAPNFGIMREYACGSFFTGVFLDTNTRLKSVQKIRTFIGD